MSWSARALALWVVAFSAFGGGPDYDAFSDRSGHILDDEQHTPAFQAMVRDTAQLEAIHADVVKGDPRATRVFEELERVCFPLVGREVAELEGRKACLVPTYRELSGTCIPNWRGLDFLPKDTEMGVRLRQAVADAYAARAHELGIENRAILSAVNALVAVSVVGAAVRPAPVGVSARGLPETGPVGRTTNGLRPDPAAQGAHSTFKVDSQGRVTGHAEWKPNPQNPSGFDQAKRVDTQHANPHTHYNKASGEQVPTPHVHDKVTPGSVRSAQPDELPRK